MSADTHWTSFVIVKLHIIALCIEHNTHIATLHTQSHMLYTCTWTD